MLLKGFPGIRRPEVALYLQISHIRPSPMPDRNLLVPPGVFTRCRCLGMTADRVREHTAPEINARIDREIAGNLRYFAAQDNFEITRRIRELDREWDVERMLEANAATLGLTGLALGIFRNRRWLILPTLVLPFLLQHAVQGWCPPLEVFRRLGFRTRREIDREKYALKVLRGDFRGLSFAARGSPGERAQAALQAANEWNG